jgi:hypothetical protein
MNTPNLETVGQALYGSQWQSDLARAFGVNDRTVRRWHSGTTPVPAAAWIYLHQLCREHATKLKALAAQLEKTR